MPEATNNDQRIYYEDTGQGTPIVLGHSFLCSGDMWRGQVHGLQDRYRLVNVDFRGHGQSGAARRPFSLYDAVDDVVAVLDQSGIDRAVWCGLSIGGMVALRAALSVPERVAGLIVMDSDAGKERVARIIRYRLMALATKRVGVRPFLNEVEKLMFGETTRQSNQELVMEWRDRFAQVDVPSTITCLDALIKRDSIVERLPEIHVPTLVLVGKEDQSLPVPISRRIHDGLPASEYFEIPGAGHLSALEQPNVVNDTIVQFMDRHFPAGT